MHLKKNKKETQQCPFKERTFTYKNRKKFFEFSSRFAELNSNKTNRTIYNEKKTHKKNWENKLNSFFQFWFDSDKVTHSFAASYTLIWKRQKKLYGLNGQSSSQAKHVRFRKGALRQASEQATKRSSVCMFVYICALAACIVYSTVSLSWNCLATSARARAFCTPLRVEKEEELCEPRQERNEERKKVKIIIIKTTYWNWWKEE